MRGDASTTTLLADLAVELGVTERLTTMASGGIVNVTEGRPALHTALRADSATVIDVDGGNVMPDVVGDR